MRQNLKPFLELIDLTFKDEDLIQTAFVHRSYHNEHKDFELPSNEKLEFLGDSVLSLITSEHLYKTYPQYQEGDYTDIKASIVNTESLYKAARELSLGEYLYLSRGEQDNNGRDNTSILADCFEAVLGVVYLEHGYDTSYKFVEKHLFNDTLDTIITKKLYYPAKNIIQEHYQEKFKTLPVYKILEEDGPEHNKMYVAGVYHNSKLVAQGEGKSKKAAEEDAARKALQSLGI